MSLAMRHCEAPHFARSLEWLLFTALEINNDEVVPSKPRWGAVLCTVSQSGVLPHLCAHNAQYTCYSASALAGQVRHNRAQAVEPQSP